MSGKPSSRSSSITGLISAEINITSGDMTPTKETRSLDRATNEAKERRVVSSQRYDSYKIAFYGSPAEKEAYR